MRKFQDLTGQRFGRLTVIEYYGKAKDGHSIWVCKCDCGNTKNINARSLKTKNTISCGCFHTEIRKNKKGYKCNFYKHGKTNTRLYNIWHSMKSRCCNIKDKNYKYYGGRDIKICNEWLKDFMNFYNWAMENGYKDNLTIDRINNNGNYEPNNCRWVNIKIQSNNRRNNHYITYNGQTHTISEWSNITNIKADTIAKRLNTYNWTIEKTLTYKKNNTMEDILE